MLDMLLKRGSSLKERGSVRPLIARTRVSPLVGYLRGTRESEGIGDLCVMGLIQDEIIVSPHRTPPKILPEIYPLGRKRTFAGGSGLDSSELKGKLRKSTLTQSPMYFLLFGVLLFGLLLFSLRGRGTSSSWAPSCLVGNGFDGSGGDSARGLARLSCD